jgi:hypothetical protein
MVVPFVHRWMVVIGVGGFRRHGARRARELCVACAGGSRQAAMTSTTAKREPRAIAAQASVIVTATFASCAFIGLSFRSRVGQFTASLAHRRVMIQRGFAALLDT